MRAALVLAAGSSRRFGGLDKLKATLLGEPLAAHAVARAREAGARRVLIVHPRRPARPWRGGSRSRFEGTEAVVAGEAALGVGASLAAGLAALRPIEREVLIFLADMPLARAPRGLRLRAGIDAVRPRRKGTPGHPLLVRVAVAKALVRPNDRGLIAGLPRARVAHVAGAAGNAVDVDTPRALAALRRRIAGAQGALRFL